MASRFNKILFLSSKALFTRHYNKTRSLTKLARRSFICSTIQKEQYLQGYKDNERHHGQYPSRTHYCGDLRGAKGEKVVLCGWAQSSRSLSQDLIFIPMRIIQELHNLYFAIATIVSSNHKFSLFLPKMSFVLKELFENDLRA
ncbi:unnamed protein product [Rhizopus stolonifer]